MDMPYKESDYNNRRLEGPSTVVNLSSVTLNEAEINIHLQSVQMYSPGDSPFSLTNVT